jgi:flavin-dependent dehydrogenase
VSCWGSDIPIETAFVASPFGPGWHLDRARFDAGLRDAAADAGAVIGGSVGQARASLVIDATGRASAVARAAGGMVERADRLVSVVGLLAAQPGDADARTLVSSTRDGWWFSSLLPDGRRVCGFQTDRDLLDRDLARDPRSWLAALHGVAVLGELTAKARLRAGPRVVVADSRRLGLPIGQADPFAVGDADMAFDPLSSLGITAAMLSAEEVVPAVMARLGGDPPSVEAALRARDASRDARWTRYRDELAEHYQRERRWPDSPFWSRRQRP